MQTMAPDFLNSTKRMILLRKFLYADAGASHKMKIDQAIFLASSPA